MTDIMCSVTQKGAQKTDGSTISTSQLLNLFTLCILQTFVTQDGAKCFYKIPCHFRSFSSAECLIADLIRGAHNTVRHYIGNANLHFLRGARHGNAVLVTTFRPSFECFGNHYCDLKLREQANSKTRSKDHAPFFALLA